MESRILELRAEAISAIEMASSVSDSKAAQEALKDHREAMDALQAVSPPGIVYATRDRKLHAHLEKGSPLPPCVKAFCDVITQDVNEDTIVTLKP